LKRCAKPKTQSQQKLHDEKRWRAIHHADTYGDKTKLLIAVMLVDRKCWEAKRETLHWERGRILSESNYGCKAIKMEFFWAFSRQFRPLDHRRALPGSL